MPVFLFLLGIVLTGAGLFLIGFSIPFRDFSLGNTLIVSGATGIVGGIIVFGIAAALRELRKISRLLEAGAAASPAGAVASAPPPSAPAPRSVAPPPARAPARPVQPQPPARASRAEPRVDVLPDPAEDLPEPPPPAAPTVADVAAENPRGLFASIRGRSQATPQPPRSVPNLGGTPAATPPVPPPPLGGPLPDLDEEEQVPPPPPPSRNLFAQRPAPPPLTGDDSIAGSGATGPAQRPPSLAALAARTAARLDLPRQSAERSAAELDTDEDLVPEPPPQKPSRNMFDSVWAGDRKAASEDSDKDTPPEPKQPEILKSGVIDGMAYTLYTDGSIEAQLPQGTLRFTSIDDLRSHLERNG